MKRFFNKSLGNFQLFSAFTLAEVLITLGIIGVVAAMTIPTLVQNYQQRQTISALKKAYSVLSSAYSIAVQENGTPDTWDISDSTKLASYMVPHLKLLKNCGASAGCLGGTVYQFLKGGNYSDMENSSTWSKAQLVDGSFIVFSSYGGCSVYSWGSTPALKNPCGDVYIDINGLQKPNQFGKDLFIFYLTVNGIVPSGSQADASGYDFSIHCANKSGDDGYGCAAWVLFNENMDYLKCGDLSWSGKHQCN